MNAIDVFTFDICVFFGSSWINLDAEEPMISSNDSDGETLD